MEMNNKYYMLRHGEAISNVKNIVSCWPEKVKNPLTKIGKEQIEKAAEELQNKNINLIFASDLLRTRQTAGIISKKLKLKIKFDKRLRELGFGVFNGWSAEKFEQYFKNELSKISESAPKGESYTDLSKRVLNFFEEINKKYKNKNILIVSHQAPLLFLEGKVKGFSIKETLEKFPEEKMLQKGELRELN